MTVLTLHSMLLLAVTLIATLCALTLAFQLRRTRKLLAQCRAELADRCSDASDTVAGTAAPQIKPQPAGFTDSLLQATLKQRLEKRPDWRQTPEKYRYAAALADQGMDAEGIAAVLQFPIEAAQQIITLKRAAQIDPATTVPENEAKETPSNGRKTV